MHTTYVQRILVLHEYVRTENGMQFHKLEKKNENDFLS